VIVEEFYWVDEEEEGPSHFQRVFCGYSFPFVGVGIELLEILGLSIYVRNFWVCLIHPLLDNKFIWCNA